MAEEPLKDRILLAADDLFTQRGVRDVSIDDICRQLSISKKTFYQFYPGKQDLAGDVIDLHTRRKLEFFRGLIVGKDSLQALKILFSENDRKRLFPASEKRMISDLKKFYPELFADHTRRKAQAGRELFDAFVRDGVEKGYFRDDLDMDVFALEMGLLLGALDRYLEGEVPCGGRKRSARTVYAAYKDIFIHTLLTEAGWNEFNK